MNWLRTTIFLILITLIRVNVSASDDTTIIYLFPGQGSDYRIYNNISWPGGYDTIHMHFPVPDKGESLKQYAFRFIPLIDTGTNFILIGMSLGGMICTELADTINPKKVILIASAKNSDELPWHYTFQKSIRLNRVVPKKTMKTGAVYLQPIVEPDSRENLDFFRSMLGIKDPAYMKRTVDMIINWERTEYDSSIIHIHGDCDNTIPLKNVQADYIIKKGSHMMVYTRADEISKILKKILE